MSIEQPGFNLLHQIFVLDAYLKRPLDCDAQDSITKNFVHEFLTVLGLEPLGPLGIYPAVDARAPGWSFIQPITTSHISAHYFEKPGKAPHIRIDAYSCEEVDWQKLVSVCHHHFQLAEWRATFIDREIDSQRERAIQDIQGVGEGVQKNQTLFSMKQIPSTNQEAIASSAA